MRTSALVCVSLLSIRPLTTEVVSSPADADLMCVADRHVGRQKVTLVILVVQVPRPHDVTEVLWRNLVTKLALFGQQFKNPKT